MDENAEGHGRSGADRIDLAESRGRDGAEPQLEPFGAPAWSRAEIAACLALFLVALALRFYRLGDRGFWTDELDTHLHALAAFDGEFWRRSHFFAFIIYRATLLVDFNEFYLRLPSALSSALSVPMIYFTARRWLGSPRVAFLASLLTAFSLYQLYFGQEARYYAMVTFLSALSMYVLFGLLHRPRALGLLLFAGVNVANYGIHPATAIFFVAQTVFLLARAFAHGPTRASYLALLAGRGATAHRLLWRLGGALALALFAGACWWLLRGYLMEVMGRLSNFPQAEMTRGVGLNRRFLLSFMYAPSLLNGRNEGLSPWAGGLYCGLFFVGLGAGLVRYRWQVAFVVFTYLCTYAALFVFKASIQYTSKYVIFLYPCYVAAVAGGLVTLSRLAIAPLPKPLAVRFAFPVAVTALMGLQAFQFTDYRSFFTREVRPIRGVLEYIRATEPEGAVVASTWRCWNQFDHYRVQYGFDDDHFKILTEVYIGRTELEHLLPYVRRGEPIFFCPAYSSESVAGRERFHDRLTSFFFERVETVKSFTADAYDLPIYRLDGRKLNFPGEAKSYDLHFADAQDEPRDEAIDFVQVAPGEWRGKLTVRALAPVAYRARVTEGGAVFKEVRFVRAGADPDSGFRLTPEPGGDFVSGKFESEKGLTEYEITVLLAEGEVASGARLTLWPAEGRIPGLLCVESRGFHANRFLRIEGRETFAVVRNSSVGYRVDVERAGRFQFTMRGLHDRPRPVWFEVEVNDRPLGVGSFDNADGSFGEFSFAADLGAGANIVRFYLLNDGPYFPYSEDLSDGNTDLVVHELAYERLAEGETGETSFWPPEMFLTDHSGLPEVAFKGSGSGGESFFEAVPPFVGEALDSGRTLRLPIPPGAGAVKVVVVSKMIPVTPGSHLYLRVKIKTEALNSYDVKPELLFFNEQNELLLRDTILLTGIAGTTDWLTVPCLRAVPPHARNALFGFTVTENGNPAESGEEVLWLSDFGFWPRVEP